MLTAPPPPELLRATLKPNPRRVLTNLALRTFSRHAVGSVPSKSWRNRENSCEARAQVIRFCLIRVMSYSPAGTLSAPIRSL